jgi:heavy metal efflux system protein
MIQAIMRLALGQRIVVVGLAVVLALVGIYSFYQLDIEAYPDPVQPLVEVLTLPTGLGAEEVERMVTVPLEYGLSSSRNLERMSSFRCFWPVRYPLLFQLGQ